MRDGITRMYNENDNPVDLDSEDSRNVFNYLLSAGIRAPDSVDIVKFGTPMSGSRTSIHLIWDSPPIEPLDISAYILMNDPHWAIQYFQNWFGIVRPLPSPYRVPQPILPPPPPVKPKLYHEGEPGYVKKTGMFFVWYELEKK